MNELAIYGTYTRMQYYSVIKRNKQSSQRYEWILNAYYVKDVILKMLYNVWSHLYGILANAHILLDHLVGWVGVKGTREAKRERRLLESKRVKLCILSAEYGLSPEQDALHV